MHEALLEGMKTKCHSIRFLLHAQQLKFEFCLSLCVVLSVWGLDLNVCPCLMEPIGGALDSVLSSSLFQVPVLNSNSTLSCCGLISFNGFEFEC